MYFGARCYDPATGRWTTPDPLGMVDGLNRYVYVNNNPVNWIDPWGLCGEKAEYLSEGDFYKYMQETLRYMINYIPQDEWNNPVHYNFMDSLFHINNQQLYNFQGNYVYGHELNYYAQGLLYKHFGLPQMSTFLIPTYYKAEKTLEYKIGKESNEYHFPPSKNTYKYTIKGYEEYGKLRKKVEKEGLNLDWHRKLFGF